MQIYSFRKDNIMTSGYDRRSRLGTPQDFTCIDPATHLVVYRGRFKTSSEQVTSFRSNTTGTRLEPRDVDPYMGFFQKNNLGIAEYLNPGPQLLSTLEAAGLAQESDYVSVDGNRLDNGHPFLSVKSSVQTSLRGQRNRWVAPGFPDSMARVGGPVYHTEVGIRSGPDSRMPFRFPQSGGGTRFIYPWTALNAPAQDTADDLASYGTRAISLCAPAVPHISMTASVGELLAGLPQIPGYALLRSGAFGSAGDEYLNTVFGIIPTLSDAKKIAGTLKKMSIALHQLRRDEGKRVRRGFKFPAQIKTEIFEPSDVERGRIGAGLYGSLGFQTQTYQGGGSSTLDGLGEFAGSTTVFMQQSREIEFSGSFTYHIPEIPGLSGRLEKYLSEHDRLLGLQLDSAAAWQLMPWSWLIDWFTDISSNLDAIQVAHDDNLVVNYGYAMEHSVRKVIAKTVFPKTYTGLNYGNTSYLNTLWKTESKRRIRANPYGFVSSADGGFWTPYRMAVLAALGISRS